MNHTERCLNAKSAINPFSSNSGGVLMDNMSASNRRTSPVLFALLMMVLSIAFLTPTHALAAAGALDALYNSVGVAELDTGGSETISGSAVDSLGRLVVTGKVSGNMLLARFNTDGSLDTLFNGVGYTLFSDGATASGSDVAVDATGRIVVAGLVNSGASADMALWRYLHNGTLDATFNSVGYVVVNSTAGGNGSDGGSSVAVDSSGRIVVAGHSFSADTNEDIVVWRFTETGILDTLFNSVGYTTYDNGMGTPDYSSEVVIDSSDRILVTGYTLDIFTDAVVLRFLEDGSPDSSFNGSGSRIIASPLGFNDYGNALAVNSSGTVYVAGSIEDSGSFTYMTLWAFNSTGGVSTVFNGIGYTTLHPSVTDSWYSVALDSSNRILVTGSGMTTARYLPDGSLDTLFNSVGYTDYGTGSRYARSIVLDDSERILVAGSNVSNATVLRYDSGTAYPVAVINSISPNPAAPAESLHFSGSGTGGTITKYEWKIDKLSAGEPTGRLMSLSTLDDFWFPPQRIGSYRLYFHVADSSGVWSDYVTQDLEVMTIEASDMKIEQGALGFRDALGNSISYAAAGSTVTVDITVKNDTILDSASGKSLLVSLYNGSITGGALIGNATISSIARTDEETVSITWNTSPTESGCLAITANVEYAENFGLDDASKTVKELSYQNNSVTGAFAIGNGTCTGGTGTLDITVALASTLLKTGSYVGVTGQVQYNLGVSNIPTLGAAVSIDILNTSAGSSTRTLSPDGHFSTNLILPAAGTYTMRTTVTDGEQTASVTNTITVDETMPYPELQQYSSSMGITGDETYFNSYCFGGSRCAVVNTPVTPYIYIRNISSKDVPVDFKVSFYNGTVETGELIGETTVSANSINTASSHIVRVNAPSTFTPAAIGNYVISAVIDSDNFVQEVVELNNDSSLKFESRERKPDLFAKKDTYPYYFNAEPWTLYNDFTRAGDMYHTGWSLTNVPVQGDTTTVRVDVYNYGTGAISNTPFVVSLYNGSPLSGTLIGNVTVTDDIAAYGGRVTVSVPWDTTGYPSGYYTLYAVVDAQNDIAEDFEEIKASDNWGYDTFDVLSYGTLDTWPLVAYVKTGLIANTTGTVSAIIRNRGDMAGAQTVSFYNGSPSEGGILLGTASINLASNAWARASTSFHVPYNAKYIPLYVVVNGHQVLKHISVWPDEPEDPYVYSFGVNASNTCVGSNFSLTATVGNDSSYHTATDILVKFYVQDDGTGEYQALGSGVLIPSLSPKATQSVTSPQSMTLRSIEANVKVSLFTQNDFFLGNNEVTTTIYDKCGLSLRAEAGADQTLNIGSQVSLSGAGSSVLSSPSYFWSVKSKPEGSSPYLGNPENVTTSFKPNKLGTYVIELKIVDSLREVYDTVTVRALPRPPSSLSAAASETVGQAIDLAWINSPDSDVSYRVYRSPVSTDIGYIAGNLGANVFQDTSLSYENTYYYRIVSVDTYGNESVETSNTASASPYSGAPPAAPSNVQATGMCDDGPKLSWSAQKDVKHFKLYYSIDNGSSWIPISTNGKSITSAEGTVPYSNTNFKWGVVASSPFGESTPTTVSGRTTLALRWNYVSVPYDKNGSASTTVYGVSGTSVYDWDSTGEATPDTNGVWVSAPTMVNGRGQILYAATPCTALNASGSTVSSATVTLKPGWNLIANPSSVTMNDIGTNWIVDGGTTLADAITANTIGNSLHWWTGKAEVSWNIPVDNPGVDPWKSYYILNKTGVTHTLTIQ